jgi:succinyl-diaminopimelate desuccinylase
MSSLDLLQQLIKLPSVTPDDHGCQELLAGLLSKSGFKIERFNKNGVSNLWARYGNKEPVFCFAGHTDVVPAENHEEWSSDPFGAEIVNEQLISRGAADMKSGLACSIVAGKRFVDMHPNFNGSLAYLITSDEEGPADDGTQYVMESLDNVGTKIKWCLIGEPSSCETLFDTLRIGRRGSLSGILELRGSEGHVAYPQTKESVMISFAKFINAMEQFDLGQGNNFFPATTFQMVYVHSDANAVNVIPSNLKCRFNLRYSTEWTFKTLSHAIETIVNDLQLDYSLTWKNAGNPFVTEEGEFSKAVVESVLENNGQKIELSTGGGTSDGRFIAPYGTEVIELGPVNKTIHKNNEYIEVADIAIIENTYITILEKMLLED